MRIKIVCGQHGAQYTALQVWFLPYLLMIKEKLEVGIAWEHVDLVVGLVSKLIILVCCDFARYPPRE